MLTLLLLLATALSPSAHTHPSNTTENLRGVSAVSQNIAWASGTHGTYLRTTDAGRTWLPAQVPDAATLDFRAVVAFSSDEAFLMSAGPGDQSRIYHTSDAGQHWQLQFTNNNPKGFFDSMVFWDPTHGIVLGDPIPDENSNEAGPLKFELLITNDGKTWTHLPPAQLPPAIEGEGAFAASNTCLAILSNSVILSGDTRTPKRAACQSRRTPCTSILRQASQGVLTADAVTTTSSAPREPSEKETAPDPNIWFATGGKAARVFHSPDRGQSWQVFDTPILHGPDSAGIFSIAFRDPNHGVIAGGDYKHPGQDGPNLAFTNNGGKTWTLSPIYPQAYFSAAAYDHRKRNQSQVRIFLISQNFILDFRPPKRPTRISPPKNPAIQFNALSPYPQGGALIVGSKGSIATIP
jgi:photosystem II stability/assembly factor-like uncharacterized protein